MDFEFRRTRRVRRAQGGVLLILILLVAGCGAAPEPASRVTIDAGTLIGDVGRDSTVLVFRGIPYAAPPVDSLRWRPPQPVEPWEGTRDATRFASTCMQVLPPPGSFYHDEFFQEQEPMSEDCLYLNVWTSAERPDEQRPVMVWIHGGAFIQGSGSMPSFDGEALAGKGAVVVTINYRLGAFGLMAHPELSAEAEHRSSGNYGLLDQIAALQWVQENISAFGGDPGRVTLFGQSAGAASVNALMASPLADGLFHRAILQSGSIYGFGPHPPLRTAEEQGREFASRLGASSIDDLRDLSPDTLLEQSRGERFSVNVDGFVLPAPIAEVFGRGDQQDVPVLTGTTADEGTAMVSPDLSASDYQSMMRNRYGNDADAFLRLYPADTDAEARESFNESFSNQLAWGSHKLAEVHSQTSSSDAYLYFLTHIPPGRDPDRYGAFHSSDLVYVFSSLRAVDRPWTAADSSLADLISSYWLNFARDGDPNDADLPNWPAYDSEQNNVMNLGEPIGPGSALSNEALELFESRWADSRN